MHDNDEFPEWNGVDRRRIDRRRSPMDNNDNDSITGLKLSLKELIGLLAILASLVGAWMNLDKTQTAIQIKHEELTKSITKQFESLEKQINEIDKKQDSLQNRIDDLERTISVLYEDSLKRKSR
jgi:peptidoglycan hydrolase CwlO-like protein